MQESQKQREKEGHLENYLLDTKYWPGVKQEENVGAGIAPLIKEGKMKNIRKKKNYK